MNILVLDTSLKTIAVLDAYESLIWTDRYFKSGDFEIYLQANTEMLSLLKPSYYLWLSTSEHVMIIEGREIDTDVEKGKHLTVTGRSLESILDGRIIWNQTILTGNLQTGIQQLLNENIISPTITDRKIANFIFEASTDPIITALTINAQYFGDNLYTAIQQLCEANNIGFKVTLTDDNKFKFKLYTGINRSYDQLTNPYIVFSPKFENLINSNYVESNKTTRTVTLVGGEGEGSARKTTIVNATTGAGTDLSRREIFTDARSISSNTSGGALTDTQYKAQLAQKGVETLAANIFTTSFDGEVDSSSIYKYGRDYYMGDIVQITNEYGMETKTRVIEYIHSDSVSGAKIYPTFAKV